MNSRERVRKAINHEEADRVPIDIGGTKVTGVHVDHYVALGRYLGLDVEPPKVYEQFQMLARLDDAVRSWLHSDVIELENPVESWGLENKDWKLWQTHAGTTVLMPGEYRPVKDAQGYLRLYDSRGVSLAVMGPTSLYYDRDCPTEMSSDDIPRADPEAWKQSIPLYTEPELQQLQTRARFLHENTEYSVHGGFLKGGLGTNGLFAGHTIGDWLCLLALDEDYVSSILSATAERAVENLRLYLQAVGPYIDTILLSGTDFGTQRGELFNPELFARLYVPHYRRINDYVHAHCQAKTMFHSCGSIWHLIEHFIAAGVDILNPVQTSTARMEPAQLKERFGGRIVFWGGGADTQRVLPHGTPQEVAAHVSDRVRTFAPGGGFVFATVHNLQYGVPPQNVEAMIQTVLQRGKYPIS